MGSVRWSYVRFFTVCWERLAPLLVWLVLSAAFFLGLFVLRAPAQLPQQPGAPAADISNIPKPVITSVDSINIRNGPNEARVGKKAVVTSDTCLLPPLTLISKATVAAQQLQIPPKAKKNYLQACVELANRKTDEAEKRLRVAVQIYPKYSAAWVTLGQVLATQKRTDEARQSCMQASSDDPKYVPAYLCLADIAAREHAWEEVLKLSQGAIELDAANDAIVYEYHAAANLHLRKLADAEKSGLRAIEVDKDHHEPRVYFVLAQIYEAKGDTANEVKQLQEYLKYADSPEDVAAVKKFLAVLENPSAPPQPTDETPKENSSQPLEASSQSWGPPDIDQVIPPAQSDVSCPLPQILRETSHRTEDLIENLQRFSADERIQQMDVDKTGKSRSATSQVVTYVAQIEANASGYPMIKEYRAGPGGGQKESVVDTGSATFALIFHPTHIGSFDFRCEGLAQLHGSPVWQLHFEESADSNKSFQAIRIGGSVYLPRLKGRAWVATNTYEVLRIETHLASPILRIDFNREHLVISYAPVEFKNHSVRLWLPESTSLYIAYHGHRYERVHTFSHFQLFSVDSAQAIKEPTPPPQPVAPVDATSQSLPIESKLLAAGADPH